MTPHDLSTLLFLQLAVILLSCRVAGWLGRAFGQPQVVCEMIAGVVLGPSVVGLWFGGQNPLFPTESLSVLYATSQIGLAIYMFLVGLDFRSDHFREKARSAVAVSFAGMLAPFILGAFLGGWLCRQKVFFSPEASIYEAQLFLGASMCITAFPMLARIIVERRISGTALGTLALAAGAIDDAAAWCVLAIVLASFKSDASIAILAISGGLAYAVIVSTIGRWLFHQFNRWYEQTKTVSNAMLAVVLSLVMIGGWVTDTIGIYAVFGAFLMGVSMPRGAFAEEVKARLEPTVTTLLLPLFFTFSGLKTRLDLLTAPSLWIAAVLVLLAACVGKGGACWLAARLTGQDNKTALGVGILMNSRGLMELIILNIGLEAKLITNELFSIMVLMAITTTLMASPLFEWFYTKPASSQAAVTV